MTFGQKLTDYLRTQGITDAEFGRACAHDRDGVDIKGVTGAAVWGWRRDRSEPPRQYRRRIIEITNGVFTAEDFI